MTIEQPIEHDDPDVSVVIPTIPENSHAQVVADLREQTHEAFEVVVVNSDNLSVCEARNRGLDVAKGGVVAFTDDDCRPPSNWVETIVDLFEKNNGLIIVEGPVRGGMMYEGYRKYPTCNIAVDRQTALDVGGFDTRFEYWREDTEFGWRMEEQGEWLFSESLQMVHPDRPRSNVKRNNEQLLKKEYSEKYNQVIVPDSIPQQINHYLWQHGFWDFIDKFRYE